MSATYPVSTVRTERDRVLGAVAVADAGVASGTHPGYQLAVWRDRQVCLAHAGGIGRDGAPLTVDVLVPWMCLVKPAVAVAAVLVCETAARGLETPISAVFPRYGAAGKGDLTFRDLLTHDVRYIPDEPARDFHFRDWDDVLDEVCRAPIDPMGPPRYSVAASWFAVSAAIEVMIGEPVSAFVRREVFERLGMADAWLAMPAGQAASFDLARVSPVLITRPSVLAWSSAYREHVPDHAEALVTLDIGAKELASCWPGTGGRGPATDLVKLYAYLATGSVEAGAAPPLSEAQRLAMRQVRPISEAQRRAYGGRPAVGFFVDQFPELCPPGTIGLSGDGGGVVVADEASGVVAAFLPNGLLPHTASRLRQRRIVRAVLRDQGIVADRPAGLRGERVDP